MSKTNNEKIIRKIPEEQEFENFRMYHQLQYDRIDKLESKRENFSNLVITISSGIYLFGFESLSELNYVNGIFLPTIVILINISAIIFANKSIYFIKMHQNRAKNARSEYAPQLNDINSKVEKIDSSKDFFRRNRIYKYLHISIIIIPLLLTSIYSFKKLNKTEDKSPTEQNNPKKEASPFHDLND